MQHRGTTVCDTVCDSHSVLKDSFELLSTNFQPLEQKRFWGYCETSSNVVATASVVMLQVATSFSWGSLKYNWSPSKITWAHETSTTSCHRLSPAPLRPAPFWNLRENSVTGSDKFRQELKISNPNRRTTSEQIPTTKPRRLGFDRTKWWRKCSYETYARQSGRTTDRLTNWMTNWLWLSD